LIKYEGYYITFQEIPNEVSLTFTITNCPHNCIGCHSPWLRDNIGKNLKEDIFSIINTYDEMITCVCFMGEGNSIEEIVSLLDKIRHKKAIYVGLDEVSDWMLKFDYVKVGHFEESLGGLDSPSTNQKMYQIINNKLVDITYKLVKKDGGFHN
jgi:anaerobic ribonucleoside-triphosphate reductase activating protein